MSTETDDGDGVHVRAGLVASPPPAPAGDRIPAELADAVGRTVLTAWMDGDRARAMTLAGSDAALDELFGRRAPSAAFAGDGRAYCTRDGRTGSYESCSYSLIDGSADGVLAVATIVDVVDGRVVLAAAGFADWND